MSEPGMNDASAVNANPPDVHHPISPGAQLAAYRKERGWTVEQVASQLNLAPRQVVAIESDDYPSLPGMPIARGFIRSYAKLLKVDAAPLLATLGGETVLTHEPMAPQKTLSTPFADKRLPSIMTDRPGFSSKWVFGVLLAALLGVAIWAAQQNSEIADLQKSAATQVKDGLAYLSGPESNPQNAPSAKEEAAPGTVPPAMGGNPSAEQNVLSAGPVDAASAAQSSGVQPSTAGQAPQTQAAAGPTAAPVAGSAGDGAPQVAKDALVLKAREESWVEVRRASNKRIILSRLMKAGEIETVEVAEPVSLVVGNAAGVDATLRGEPLQFKAASGNVARLNLK